MKKKITLKDFLVAIDYRLADGYEFLWECYGSYAYGLNWEKPDFSASACVIYDIRTQRVYEMSVWDCADEHDAKVLRWIDPEYLGRHKKESRERGIKFKIAIDKIEFEETTPAKLINFLKKLHARKEKKRHG
jgi:hypothetical protein